MLDINIHLVFDVLAVMAGLAAGLWQKIALRFPDNPHLNTPYVGVLIIGAVLGGYVFGTWNLQPTQPVTLAHSLLGALVGGVAAVEIYKIISRIQAPTGIAFAFPLSIAIAVGRMGCLLSGMEDMTYGTPTALPWGMDFGDGIKRHPVQLYESLTIIFWAVGLFFWSQRNVASYGLYAFPATTGIYALQRFGWEWLKPYPAVIGPFNLFHVLSVLLFLYSVTLLFIRRRHARRPPGT